MPACIVLPLIVAPLIVPPLILLPLIAPEKTPPFANNVPLLSTAKLPPIAKRKFFRSTALLSGPIYRVKLPLEIRTSPELRPSKSPVYKLLPLIFHPPILPLFEYKAPSVVTPNLVPALIIQVRSILAPLPAML